MNLNDLKIGTQLKLGFTLLLLFVVGLGAVSYLHADKIHLQTKTMHEHPFKVGIALGDLEADILNMRLATRDLMLAKTPQEKRAAVQAMEVSAADADKQFTILEHQYLGPRSDLDEARKAFIRWKTIREENTRLAISGDIAQVKESVQSTGAVGIQRDLMMAKIAVIDEFARKKANTLYTASEDLHRSLNRQLFLLVALIMLLSLAVIYVLLRNIRTPLKELNDTARRFHGGDMSARSEYACKNEFGLLSDSFNTLAESIQESSELDRKIAHLSRIMLNEYDAAKFFRSTLDALAEYTGSQISAAYLLSPDKKTFEHFSSTGAAEHARTSFAATRLEGEFGPVLASRKIQHIRDIPADTRFTFHSVSGTFVPREIITMPIIVKNEVIAIVSLATIGSYSPQSVELVESILVTLCARVEGILSYHKLQAASEQLEHQNRELESQKTELISQSTELISQNSELEVQKNQLDEASRLKTNFLSNMSHELRTPLNSVIALSGVLNRRLAAKIPDEEFSYLEVIERNGKHLLSLINDILDISRIEAGREEIEISTFNANGLIAEVAGMIHPQADQRNIELRHDDSESRLALTSDMDKCRHILQNLIANAVKFTEKGSVTVTARQTESHVLISVADTGIGIDESHLAHIFDEFRQADGSTSRRFGGTGLGLSIAKKYANLLGGTISVESTPGEGSVFTLSLPLRYAAEGRIIEAETAVTFKNSLQKKAPGSHSGSAQKTILLVEDSEPAVIQLKDMLAEGGYQILVARDGSEALEIINQTVPDAMVLDLMMPGVDGFEVLQVIRNAERTAHIPVLILTAKHITKDELSMLKRNNVHQLIQKGDVNRLELQQAVASMVMDPEPVRAAAPKRKVQAMVGKPVVLIVEDNPDNMITVKAILEDRYTLLEAVDGKSGVACARKHIPHLILMDIALPEMNGIEAFKSIRNDPRLQHIPVIALTASAMLSDREAILAYGFDSYVAKPIDEPLFFKAINEALYGD